MRNRRFVGVLASFALVGAGALFGQEAASRTEALSRAMARVGTERVFAAYAVDYGSVLYGAWVAGHDLYLEQFHAGQFEIVALDLRTGERKWIARIGRNRLKVAPYPGDRYVALMTECDGGMIVINRTSGAHDFQLRAEMNTPTTSPAASSDTTVYVASLASNQVAALSPGDGRSGWRYPAASLITAGPIITPRLPRRLVVVGCLDGTVMALPATGWNEEAPKSPAWNRRLFGAVNALVVGEGIEPGTPAPEGAASRPGPGRRIVSILASCEDHGLYCLDVASGEPRWVARTDSPFKDAATVSGGTVFARSGGRMYAFDLATGKDKWAAGKDGIPAPWERAMAGYAADDKRVYLRREPKEICRVDAKTGVMQACARLLEFDYVLAAPDANMIVGITSDGYVVAYR